MPKIKSKFLDKLHRDFTARMKVLRTEAVDEYEFLEDLLKTLEDDSVPVAERERQTRQFLRSVEVSWDMVEAWFRNNYGPTDRFRVRDLALQFDKTTSWASRRTEKLLEVGLLETYGNGLYRRPPIHTGEKARLSVGNGVIN